ncbi:hypothetical protein MHO82_12910 [Vibrio sp. Of7-15]|uniref:hypothetical protein n=1 Tax=Vibrio sp. Of7-15 TaxID=2724879 RepID=UPI001EF221A3|nr:hypothetical protein [Vibrio sp. Of7-15]MCG7497764.1 hypothetical protein [Vibrio sp. Of7-15]
MYEELKSHSPRPANESIAFCRALLGAESQVGLMYDNLTEEVKRSVCFSAGFTRRHIAKSFSELTVWEKKQVHRVINTLVGALTPLSHKPSKDFY